MTRPLIGITVADGDSRGKHALRVDYVRSVEQAGGVPVVLAPLSDDAAPLLVDRLDGIVLSGGGDVDPGRYGMAPHPRLGTVSPRRDAFELALTREALRRDLPLLAICRGRRLGNARRGDTPPGHPVRIEGCKRARRQRTALSVLARGALLPQTRLRSILGRDTLAVNSFHHQAADRLGDGLEVAARCPVDGVVEGIEMPSRRFVIGVQWHPESFWHRPHCCQALFEAHVEACRS